MDDAQRVLQGQSALVTGANSGIGKTVAQALALAGAAVAVNYVRDRSAAQEVVDTIEAAGGRAMAVEADVSQEAQVQAMV